MTALKDIERIETTALWRASEDEQRREIYVAIGDSSLVITDVNGTALAHWSLPAVLRLNPGKRPAVYAPGPDDTEELEIADATMIDAIERVRRAIDAHQPHPGRLRLATFIVTAASLVILSVFWLPEAVRDHTLRVLPLEKRVLIGRAMLSEIARFSGNPCRSARGAEALAALNGRVLPGTGTELVVLRHAAQPTMHLPGQMILISGGLLTDYDTPEVVAGYILAEHIQTRLRDPMLDLLNFIGFAPTFRLLTTGELDTALLRDFTERQLTRRVAPLPSQTLIAWFENAELSSQPYALALDPSGETTLELIEGDPFRGRQVPALLSDSNWLTLQNICEA